MYKKKIIGIALIAALVSSMTAVSVSAGRVGFDGDDTIDNYFENHTLGIIGDFNQWSSDIAPMTDADGDGVFVGVVKDVAPATHSFKVRADGDWNDSWGEYEENDDRTMNSQTDCSITVDETADVIVMLDTNGDDEALWPVSYFVATEASKYGIVGSLTGWGNPDDASYKPDFAMYQTEEGKYVGIAKDVAAGEGIMFKVRADGKWDSSWGVYDEEKDSTKNGMDDNVTVNLDTVSDIVVFLDASDEDDELWAVSYAVISDGAIVTEEYTGKVDDGEDGPETPVAEPSRYGIVGDFTGWGSDPDYPMYETATKGVYVGKTDALKADTYQVKVRADAKWDESWGMYDEEKDSTKNGFDDNINVTVEAGSVIFVQIDTTGEDDEVWGLSYAVVTDETAEPDWQYVGKPQAEESSKEESSKEESSKEESKPEDVSKPEESSEPDTSVPVDEPSKPEVYETKITDYIYFDNSETKWAEVYAYWWNTDFARTYDIEDNDWGWAEKILNADGTPVIDSATNEPMVNHPVLFPGTKMTQIEGTDIWQVRIPFNATKVIFNSGFTDDEVKDPAQKNGYQTENIAFDAAANAGQIYIVDAKPTTDDPKDKNANPTPGRGVFKAKYTYKVGEWKAYTAYAAEKGVEPKFMSEQIGEIPQTSDIEVSTDTSKEESQQSVVVPGNDTSKGGTSTQPSQTQPTQNSTQTSTTTPINTGDAAMPIAVAVVAALALGTAVVVSRKKVEE